MGNSILKKIFSSNTVAVLPHVWAMMEAKRSDLFFFLLQAAAMCDSLSQSNKRLIIKGKAYVYSSLLDHVFVSFPGRCKCRKTADTWPCER